MAKLTIVYDKDVLTNGYYMKTTVLPGLDTDPSSMQPSLVVRQPNVADGESLVRVASLVDLEALPLAGDLVYFSATGIGTHGVGAGDILRFSALPPEWVRAGLSANLDYVIDSIVDVNTVKINVGAPVAYYYRGDDITWQLLTSGSVLITMGTGGETLREQAAEDVYYRMTEYVDVYPDLNSAVNAQASFDAQAQSLADSANLDAESFSGTDTEVYE